MTGNSHLDIVRNLQLPFGEGFPFDQAMFDLIGFFLHFWVSKPTKGVLCSGSEHCQTDFLGSPTCLAAPFATPDWQGAF
jgi:hypothetical protein